MSKTQKELAFLRDLYIETDWTERFTNVFDEKFKFSGEKKILYVNAGTGSHALALRKKMKNDPELFGVCETQELLTIANAKEEAVKSGINFSKTLPKEKFDAVIADASFTRPKDLKEFLAQTSDLTNKQFVCLLPTAGSFGEIFSILWESLFDLDLLDKCAEVERLVSEIPTTLRLEDWAQASGLSKIEIVTKNEYFNFESGEKFITAPLVADFLLPAWLDFLDKKEQTKVRRKLVQTIDDDRNDLAFRFSVKATLLIGEKS
jgi:hypothetical protein